MNAETHSASNKVKVVQGYIALGTLYVRLTCPNQMNNRERPYQNSRNLRVRTFKFDLSTF